MGVENTTKDVAGTWRIFVVLESDSLRVFHIKKEVCIQNHFMLEWKLRFSLSYHQMDQLRGISFEVSEIQKIIYYICHEICSHFHDRLLI